MKLVAPPVATKGHYIFVWRPTSHCTAMEKIMQIIKNKALQLKLKHPQKVTAVIPKSKQLSSNDVLVHWGIDEAQVLRNLNIKVPSPIEGRYKWTGKYPPYEHQKTTAAFLTMNRRAFCFSEQGTGKTMSAIWAADYLLDAKLVKRVLVICPLSIMDSAWRADLFSCAMHRSVTVCHGAADKRKKLLNQNCEFVIINYDGIKVIRDEIANGGFDLIIVDEANHYKNAQSQRWKTLVSLIRPETWVWMMTGTPAAQSPVDAYGLAKIINPNAVPKFFGSFRDQVMHKVTNFRYLPKPEATTIVHNVLQPAIRFTKEQCLDLPEMTYVTRNVELTPQQKKYYEQLKKQMVIAADGEMITAANAAVNMNKLLQISCGAVYSDDKEVLEFDIKGRYSVLHEVIQESSQKVLVFVPFRHTIEILSNKLTADNITNEVISGSVTANKRTDIFKRFQETSEPRVLIIQPQSAAHGVTLTAANTIVWWGPTPSLETYAQANARVHRNGQKHPCTVIELQGSKVEQHMYRMLRQKINVHERMIDLYKEILD